MKYYVVEIQTFVDGTKDSVGIYTFDTKIEAEASFHTRMGGAMKNANVKSENLFVLNSANGVERTELYVRPVVEETTEE